jgi:hypothetical protein
MGGLPLEDHDIRSQVSDFPWWIRSLYGSCFKTCLTMQVLTKIYRRVLLPLWSATVSSSNHLHRKGITNINRFLSNGWQHNHFFTIRPHKSE